MGFLLLLALLVVFLVSALKVLREYERGVVFRLGRLVGARGPGVILLIPLVDRMVKVDLRTVTMDVQPQEVITRDNVPVRVDAVVYFRVVDAARAIVEVESYHYATAQIARTTLRSVVGQVELDDLLAHRERINQRLQQIVDEATEPWGIKVSAVEIKDVTIPQGLLSAIARQAAHARADPGHPYPQRHGRARGHEERRHQRERDVPAVVGQRAALGPRGPHRAQRADHLAQSGHGRSPGLAEAAGDVGFDLRAEPQHEAAAGEVPQVPRGVGQRRRAAGEGQGDRRAHHQPRGVLGRQGHGEERIVVDLVGPQAVEAEPLRGLCHRRHLAQGAHRQACVDLHRAPRPSIPPREEFPCHRRTPPRLTGAAGGKVYQ